MQKRSLMMLGATMRYDVDAGNGQVVGSIVKMRGKVLGMELLVEEIITEWHPPWRKSWQTLDRPKFLVIDSYGLRHQADLGRHR